MMSDDLEIGEYLRSQLTNEFELETESWAIDRISRVTDRLNVMRRPELALETHILWMDIMTAFTAPGRHIYISRHLLERASSDDPIAFVLAHEMAHHDLGHLHMFRGPLASLRHVPGVLHAALLLRFADQFVLGPEKEHEADIRALDICLSAGYDGNGCLELFEILEAYALDHRDLDIVYGPNDEPQTSNTGVGALLRGMRSWTWEHVRGYECLMDRKETLLQRLGSY
jgi:predicted Zn-dependent protease